MKMLKAFVFLALTASICQAGDPPATHGMLVFGTKKVFASHLPMFHSPHDYQAIFEIRLDSGTLKNYLDDKAKSPDSIYTLVPEPFVLTELSHHPMSVKAVIYHGHFEREGTPITGSVTVEFSEALFFQKLSPATPRPPSYQGLVFGGKEELFLIHRIAGAPDFDQVLEIEPTPAPIPPAVDFPGVPDTALSGATVLDSPHVGRLQTKTLIYLETDDLKDLM